MSEKKAGVFTELIDFYKRIVDFKGRARRREYWVAYLWNIVIMLILLAFLYGGIFLCMDFRTEEFQFNLFGIILCVVFGLLLLVFGILYEVGMIAVSVRRCHDIGKSGWWFLWCILGSFLCGIGGIVWLVFSFMDSVPETNKWGPSPKSAEINKYDNNKSIIISIVASIISYIVFVVVVVLFMIMGMAINGMFS